MAASEVPATARLVIGSRPSATLYIDGRRVRTGGAGVEVTPGRHLISLVAADGRRTTVEVEVEAGEVIRRTWDFERLDWR